MGLKDIVKQFEGKKILIIGDIMLDKYIWGNVERISPEAPVPVIEITRESQNLGAAGNVANTVHYLHGIPLLVGVIGEDREGEKIKEILKEKGLNIEGIFVDPSRPTTTKTRLVVENPRQQLARIDREKKELISEEIGKKIYDFVFSLKDEYDVLLFQDYDKGVLSGSLITRIISLFKDKIITADPKFNNFFEYKKVTLFKPNKKEVELAMGVKLNSPNIKSIARSLRKKIDCKALLITLGEKGMLLCEEGKEEIFIPANVREVYDTTGAGDIVITVGTMALSAGAQAKDAGILANIAAGIEVSKFGAVPITYEELLETIEE
jgi:rfaE bifunctional protein kinase chain/domain